MKIIHKTGSLSHFPDETQKKVIVLGSASQRSLQKRVRMKKSAKRFLEKEKGNI
ncbi:hypothetical protein HMPREF0201_04803 [Cedecea davisae DSM 4568]|uniref:Uncharacterized protein n=1 Tax=Cedecea davisae DSM 4568 TaxID=566551 RepID=S3IX72_9ENTR|nr:hypothetical protein HMPREF0201_04803 [Cedecea davisae DSM 4568]